jgi:hypothetical protein
MIKTPPSLPRSNTSSKRLPELTDRLILGDQGLRVSPCCLGMVDSADTVIAAFEAGINFFFITTDLHWPLYAATRRGIRELLARRRHIREQIVVAGVCYQTQPIFCYGPFEELLNEIPELERLDVLIAGGVYGNEQGRRTPIYEQHRSTRFLGARAIGATFHDRSAALTAIRDQQVDIAFIRYNPGHPGAVKDLFAYLQGAGPASSEPKLANQGPSVEGTAESGDPALARGTGARTLLFNFKSTFGYVPPAEMEAMGLHGSVYWHPQITDHYRFVLSRREFDGILIGPRTPEDLGGIAEALANGPLTEEEQAYLLDVAMVARGGAKVEPEEQVSA